MKTRFILLIISIGIFAFLYHKFRTITKPLTAPKFNVNAYWGRGKATGKEIAIINYQINIESDQLQLLKEKLSKPLRFPEPLEDSDDDDYGVKITKFEKLIEFWRRKYLLKWYTREKYLNSLPHYITKIQGLTLHYIHAKPNSETKTEKLAYPLLLLHGWPGSIREFYDIIPKLTASNESDIVFKVVAPSLPGFGFSEGSAKPGFGIAQIAIVLRNLMLRVGYEKFYIQGGDWGSIIGATIATLFPENVLGYHSNMCFFQTPLSVIKGFVASFAPSYFIDTKYEDFVFPLMEKYKFILAESGYFHLQATKPDTIGAVLQNSPIAIAAYFYEKFSTYFKDISNESFLDNVMIYYFTNTSTTAARIYAEAMSKKQLGYDLPRVPTTVPTGCARFKNDLGHLLDWQLIDKFPNLIHSTYYNNGGHFAAMEIPDILYNDFIEFVKKTLK